MATLTNTIPEKTIERLSEYRRTLLASHRQGITHIFSHVLAGIHGITAVQVRRDLMLIGFSSDTKKGCSSVAHMMACPTAEAAVPTGAAISAARPIPASTVTMGVTRMSILVSLLTALPTSAANSATNSTASGPPAPPI